MNEDKLQKIRDPCFWINDYFNAWAPSILGISMAKKSGCAQLIRENPLSTFREYVEEKEYYGKKCDLTIIPEKFIYQTDRLVRIYNHFISQEEFDYHKLERIINLAQKVIFGYRDKP